GQVGDLLLRAVEGGQEREGDMVRAAEHAVIGRYAQPAVLFAEPEHGVRDDMVVDVDIHPASWQSGPRASASRHIGSHANFTFNLAIGDRKFPGDQPNVPGPGVRRYLPACWAGGRGAVLTPPPATVGVVGLGNMGLPMAGHLIAAGYRVQGYDVRPEAVEALARTGGVPAASAAEAAAGAELVITSLPSVAALQEV